MQLREVLKSTDLMTHQVQVRDVEDRRAWLAQHCGGRSVLHVGCCDVPIFDPNSNLHIELSECTDRLDGLDISEAGIEVLRRHVDGMYFTDPAAVTGEYDLVLIPEVLEHTPNPGDFLAGMFSIAARQYLITAPNIQWYERVRREGGLFHETVHGDHKAWYSPYTLLNTLRPFIDEDKDEVEVFLLSRTGSVAALVSKPLVPQPRVGREPEPVRAVEAAVELARSHVSESRDAAALRVLAAAWKGEPDPRLLYAELEVLLGLGRSMDALRRGVSWMREHPGDQRCRHYCAEAMERLGDHDGARKLRGVAAADS